MATGFAFVQGVVVTYARQFKGDNSKVDDKRRLDQRQSPSLCCQMVNVLPLVPTLPSHTPHTLTSGWHDHDPSKLGEILSICFIDALADVQ